MNPGTLRCESCDEPADVRLRDGSVWCESCHTAALAFGFDEDEGVWLR